MDALTVFPVFVAEVCLALLLSRTLVAHLRAFLRHTRDGLRNRLVAARKAGNRQRPPFPIQARQDHRRSP